MVEFNDGNGSLVKKSFLNYEGVYHLSVVEVTGELRNEDGNYFLKATKVYVQTPSPLDVPTYEKNKKDAGY
jgi:hypothetical protein